MAESLLYTTFGTPITFGDTAGSPSAVLALKNLGANAGIYSNRYDRGAASAPIDYLCLARFRKGVAGVAGQAIGVYVYLSDGTDSDGTLATTGTTLTAAMLGNAWWSMPVIVESTSTTVSFIRRGMVTIPSRYFSVGVMNSVIGLLTNTDNIALVSFTPVIAALQPEA